MKKGYLIVFLLLLPLSFIIWSYNENKVDFNSGADIITTNKTDYFYTDEELSNFISVILKENYKLESPKVVRIKKHYTEGGIAGSTYDYTFYIKDLNKKYIGTYMNIGEALDINNFYIENFYLYDSLKNHIILE